MDNDASPPIIPLENLPEALLSLLPTLNQEHGYQYCCLPGHPLANKSGKVYVSRLIMSVKLGRWVEAHEMVRFING